MFEDLTYRIVDGEKLLARLYRPEGGAIGTLVVEVHGGAWTMNDRTTNSAIRRRSRT